MSKPDQDARPTGPEPRVTVIMIYFNASRFMAEAIDSVLAQDFTNFELLLVNDGSTDDSRALAEDFAAKHPQMIACLDHPGRENRGMSASRNLGLARARGEFVAFIDADDRWKNVKLSEQLAVFEAHPDIDAAFGAVNYWRSWAGGADQIIPTGHHQDRAIAPPEAMLRLYPLGRAPAPCPSDLIVRRRLALGVGGFEESFTGPLQMYEDQAFFAKLYLNGTMYFDARNWLDYRIHDDSCVAAVSKAGRYGEVRRHFLAWLDDYLGHHPEKRTKQVDRALRKARFLSRHSVLARLMTMIRRR